MAQSYYAAGRYLDSIKFAKQAVKEDLDNPIFHRLLVQCYRKLEMIDEGRHEYKRLVEKNPDKPHLSDHLKSLDQPIDSSLDDLKPEQREVKSLYEKGVRLFLEGHFQEAVGPLTSVMNVEHLKLSAGALLVRSYLKIQEIKSALVLFERLDVMRRGTDEFVLNLCYEIAEVYVRENRPDKAQELYSFICRSNVSFKDAFKKLERIQSLREVT